MVFLIYIAGFARVFPEKRFELKSLKGQTKAEEEGTPGPFLLSFRPSLKALEGPCSQGASYTVYFDFEY
jgi:hypothetical protein